ncbi:MAG: hypothetical protein ABSF93_13950 [Candidatus Sulfotelmatobacter sp.]
MSIEEPEQLAGMRAAGLVVRLMLEAMRAAVRPGITKLNWTKWARA